MAKEKSRSGRSEYYDGQWHYANEKETPEERTRRVLREFNEDSLATNAGYITEVANRVACKDRK